jgi:hypothetical protein
MIPVALFWVAFVLTVILMGCALVTGHKRRRKIHLVVGPLTIVSLAVAIVLTEKLMRRYTFPADELAFHLIFAKAGGLLAIPVILSGIWLLRQERARVLHRIAVYVWLASVAIATGTGLWMFGHGTLKAL